MQISTGNVRHADQQASLFSGESVLSQGT
jgi:hypothetical protein